MDNLKLLRQQHNLSQQKLAEILHVSQQSIYKYENDITAPDIETLINMADYFNTSVDYLIGYSDIPRKIESTTQTDLNADELDLIKMYRKLSEHQKNLSKMIMHEYSKK
jgi:transcriptional regulator with XRE-family HTH domain